MHTYITYILVKEFIDGTKKYKFEIKKIFYYYNYMYDIPWCIFEIFFNCANKFINPVMLQNKCSG